MELKTDAPPSELERLVQTSLALGQANGPWGRSKVSPASERRGTPRETKETPLPLGSPSGG
jgi:hypothetical protein